MLEQLRNLSNLDAVRYYIWSSDADDDDEARPMDLFNAILDIPTKRLDVEVFARLQESTNDDIDMSTPSLNTAVKYVKMELVISPWSACRYDILHSLSRLPSLATIECDISDKKQYYYGENAFHTAEITQYFVSNRKELNIPCCTVIPIKKRC
jgi:hypothetical protein